MVFAAASHAAAGAAHNAVIDDTGRLWLAGSNAYGQLARPGRTADAFATGPAGVQRSGTHGPLGHSEQWTEHSAW